LSAATTRGWPWPRQETAAGAGNYLVAEADESDGSFLRLPPTIAIVTNIDEEHLDHYKSFAAVKDAFVQFSNKVPFYGACVVCLDDPHVQSILPRLEKRTVTYGMHTQADVTGRLLESTDAGTRFEVFAVGEALGEIRLRMPGEHNVLNALAAVTVGRELELPFEAVGRALEEFLGVARRFEIRAVEHDVVFVDDYGHHPTEIAATLKAARDSYRRRIVTVFQPHRYSRTQLLLEGFGRAFFDTDVLFLGDIYAASETPIPGVTSAVLADKLREYGHKSVRHIPEDKEKLTDVVASTIQRGDLVLTLGAGDVSSWNDILVEKWCRRVESQSS
jgi:UDP-N-acetylmuramate--alanine ligase